MVLKIHLFSCIESSENLMLFDVRGGEPVSRRGFQLQTRGTSARPCAVTVSHK